LSRRWGIQLKKNRRGILMVRVWEKGNDRIVVHRGNKEEEFRTTLMVRAIVFIAFIT